MPFGAALVRNSLSIAPGFQIANVFVMARAYNVYVERASSAILFSTLCGVVTVSVSRGLYSKRVVLATAYKLADRWAVLVDDEGPDRWRLYLIGAGGSEAHAALKTLVHELTDQVIRERLDEETRDLRTLIVAQVTSVAKNVAVAEDRDELAREPFGLVSLDFERLVDIDLLDESSLDENLPDGALGLGHAPTVSQNALRAAKLNAL